MATQPSDNTEFPPEIILKPLALVGLSGLDTINNAVHRAIWDAFSSNRRADRAPVRFKLLNNTFEFPVVKPKRSSYEWYIPKGILKKNWIHKRVSLIPAVVIIFYDMEWNDPQWNEKIIECASRVQSIRAAVEGHATRVAVVVVQSGLSPPPSEYMLGAERAQALCAACEIQSKSLFVLPHSDHLIGYIIRLENAFYDIAQNYYHHETKNIKQHRDHLNKTTHQYLFVRHQFKLGFLNELKQDLSTAHKHYMHAYNNLMETRTVDTNTHEVRTVAGYINYKLCKLLFALNLPRDAIAQLKTHIERYKSRVGPTELLFEHYAWIARQYSAFGELFDEAIRAGLPAIQSQHPGFYYQHAAQFTVKRRQAMRSVCSEATQYPPPPDPMEGIVEFYGQRPWRPGRLSADPHDPQKEQAAVLALQYNERIFNHSALIISFLGCAIAQFKTFHSPRMRKQLVVEMANEYFYCADYGKALTLLSHMLWDYRREKWWFLASHVLNRALQCAYLSAKIQDYLQLSVEALSKYIQVPNNDKDRIFQNIISILNLNIPGPEPDLPASSQSKALELWQLAIEKEPLTVAVDMANISSFLEVKSKFKQQKYRMDETVEVELYVRLSYNTVLHVKNAFMTISSHTETIEIPITNDTNAPITLEGGKVKRFLCPFKSNPLDNGSDLHIKNVSFVLDSDRKRKIVMNFKTEESKVSDSTIHPELLHFILSPKTDYEFDCIVPLTTASVTARECRLSIEVSNASPALQGEWFPTTFTITNNEESSVYDVKLVLSLLASPDNPNPESVTDLSLQEGEAQTQPLKISAGSISQLSNNTHTFYLKTNRTATTTVQIKVSYLIDLPEISKLECVKDFITKITVIKPFEVSTNFVAMNFQPIPKCFVDDPFIVMPQIKILSPWELMILDTDLEVTDCFCHGDETRSSSCINNLEVAERNIASDAICIQAKYKPKDLPTRVGLYNITWRRKNNPSGHHVMSSTALSGLPIDECPVSIEVNYPEVVELLTSVPLKCTLIGKSHIPVRLSLTVEGTDAYMFSGYKKLSVTVPPNERVELCYNIHPLVAGNTTPPRLKPTVLGDTTKQDVVREMFEKIFPQNIFVMPKYNK
ncbi:trafficking protein particle complex subunit 11 [Pectinophora gossypiella]|uniref:Trafficking protein particle complex subunit 11 n=1 Tax=Pectinophora gossypiella TaxID=13191 RepID=A0A1E1WAX0_PECGO|nr:trafficking protein particle complex subunit 11 [Pectinophora gossypiella]